jgi:hypothetical protein
MAVSLLTKRELDAIATVALAYNCTSIISLDFAASEKDKPSLQLIDQKPNQLGSWLKWANEQAYDKENGTDAAYNRNSEEFVEGATDNRLTYKYAFADVKDSVTAIKLIGHYMYNCAAWRGWWFSDQREFCNGLIGFCVQDLDGYEKAEWDHLVFPEKTNEVAL